MVCWRVSRLLMHSLNSFQLLSHHAGYGCGVVVVAGFAFFVWMCWLILVMGLERLWSITRGENRMASVLTGNDAV